MRAIWKSLLYQFTRDDLFVRVLFALFAMGIGGLGAALCLSIFYLGEAMWILLLMIGIGSLLICWGCLLLARTFFAPKSRWSKLAEKYHPDTSDGEGIIIIFVLFFLPAVLLTLILRVIGIRGRLN